MDSIVKGSKWKKNPFSKIKSCTKKSLDDKEEKRKTKRRVAPEGCFSVYVGLQKQRFVIKTEFANHPLFKILLEDAALEYGYSSEGPIILPCDFDLFIKVLAEIENSGHDDDDDGEIRVGCTGLLSTPTRRSSGGCGGGTKMDENCGSYGLLTPSPILKMSKVYNFV